MWKQLYEEGIISDIHINYVLYQCRTEAEMVELYENLNRVKSYNASLNDDGTIQEITPQTKGCLQYIINEMSTRFGRQISTTLRPNAPKFNMSLLEAAIRDTKLHEVFRGEEIMDAILSWNDEWGRTLTGNKLRGCVDGFYLPCSDGGRHAHCKWVYTLCSRMGHRF